MEEKYFDKLPPELQTFVSSYAYEHGHAYGQEEVNLMAESMAADLLPHIEAYTKRIKS